jgi:transposase
MSRPIGSSIELERRRKRAVQAVSEGQTQTNVARVLGVSRKSVCRWVKQSHQPGGLNAKPHLGNTPGLSEEDLERLEELLMKGAKANGWHNELWTAARVARLIASEFGVNYHPEHVRRILKNRLNWTCQKPRRKAREANEKEVARWLDDEFPRILRDAYRRKAYLVFLDESGFFLTPTLRRTWAPRGQTPILDAWDRRDRWSAISCITISPVAGRPGLYFNLYEKNVHAEDIVGFLSELHKKLGAMTVIWDRGPVHIKSKAVRAWLADHPDVIAEDFPGYMPELNPDEGVWGWTKYGRLANLAANDKEELWEWVMSELITLKHSPDLLRGFINETELPGVSLAA